VESSYLVPFGIGVFRITQHLWEFFRRKRVCLHGRYGKQKRSHCCSDDWFVHLGIRQHKEGDVVFNGAKGKKQGVLTRRHMYELPAR
jgi:hypothetical protein